MARGRILKRDRALRFLELFREQSVFSQEVCEDRRVKLDKLFIAADDFERAKSIDSRKMIDASSRGISRERLRKF